MSPPHVREFGDSTQGTGKMGLAPISPTKSNVFPNSEARQRMPRILEEKKQLAQAARSARSGRNAAPLIQLTTPDAVDTPPNYR